MVAIYKLRSFIIFDGLIHYFRTCSAMQVAHYRANKAERVIFA